MKRRLLPLCMLFLASVTCVTAQNTIYLSPQGDDASGDGSKAKPYYSLAMAFNSAAAAKPTADTLYVEVASGDYFMERALTLNKPNVRPIVVRGSADQMPRMMGGKRIEGWEHWRDGIYRAYIPEVERYGFSFEQFYVNGNRATLARTPNDGFYMVVGESETHIDRGQSRRANYAVERVVLSEDGMQALDKIGRGQKALTDNEIGRYVSPKVRFYHKWDNTVKLIEHIQRDSSSIFFAGLGAQSWNPVTKGSRYFLFDYFEALDAPGEWYLDRDNGYLYYYPAEGEDISTAECIAPTLRYWMRMNGAADGYIENISFRNISFQYSSYKMPVKGNDAEQAAASVEAAMEFNFVKNISFLNCEMMHTGTCAIWMQRGCHNNTLDHCYLYDLGAGGIKLGEWIMRDKSEQVSSGNTINNCIITNGGHVFPCGVGVSLFYTAHNRLTHNEISNFRYSGVSVGWVWGYSYSPTIDNYVAYNHIHHIGWGELSDMGAVYTLGVSPGTKVVHNVIHDIVSYDYGGWGLYTDEGSTGIEMSYNLVYRCKCGGFHQHYGKENKIENNIFALGYLYQAQLTRAEEHKSFDFKRNIILHERGQALQGNWANAKIDFADNIYWSLSDNSAMTFADMPLGEWKSNHEADALNIDPMFIDPKAGDFRFKSRRAIKKIGFEEFDYSEAGVYGSDEWREKAKMPTALIEAFDKATLPRLGNM
ncbi:MAG: right-handed parallel beta-helix repeat-containing protein [Alistipes sp.]|nr:right-handed parallel beta-helix repeat-containing protein [Alistipes sp.]